MIYNSTLYKTKSIYKGDGIYKGVDALPPVAAMTLRFKFSDLSYSPVVAGVGSSGAWQQVKVDPNIWDWTRTTTSWTGIFKDAFADSSNLVDVIDAETSDVTSFFNAFNGCSALASVCEIDATECLVAPNAFWGCVRLEEIKFINSTKCTNFQDFARECASLEKVPLLKTDALQTATRMFYACYNVESGALALYQQMSTQTTPPSTTTGCFANCGRDTTTGAAELAQIPASWGGTAP